MAKSMILTWLLQVRQQAIHLAAQYKTNYTSRRVRLPSLNRMTLTPTTALAACLIDWRTYWLIDDTEIISRVLIGLIRSLHAKHDAKMHHSQNRWKEKTRKLRAKSVN